MLGYLIFAVLILGFAFFKKPQSWSQYSYAKLGFLTGIALNIIAVIASFFEPKPSDSSFSGGGALFLELVIIGIPLILIFWGIGKFKDKRALKLTTKN